MAAETGKYTKMDKHEPHRQPHMLKSETVDYIRALLMAHKQMYTLEEFLRDFEEDGGYDLPAFGYGNSLEFLKSIPDTVQVIPVKNTIYLKVMVSQNCADIRDEVVNKDGRRRRRRRGGRRRKNARQEQEKNVSENENHPESPNE